MRTLAPVLVALFLVAALPSCVRHVAAVPRGEEQDPPPGMVAVNIVSDDDRKIWEVHAGGNPPCNTPCTQWVSAQEALLLKSRSGHTLYVPSLEVEVQQSRRALVVAENTHRAKQVNGTVFTTLGGMALVTAVTLTAVGCSNVEKRGGACTAGLITGGVAVPVTAVALWMLIDSAPKVHVLPLLKAKAASGQPQTTLAIVPNGVAGTF